MDPVTHFEIPVDDSKRASEFYTKAFGWKMNMLGSEMGNYVLATTTQTDDKGMIKTPGHINGGLFERSSDKPAQFPSVVMAVKDIKESILKINKSGGKVIGDPVVIPGVGHYVSFFDTEGNRLSIIEPLEMRK